MDHWDTTVQAGKQILQDIFHIGCLVDIAVGNPVDRDRGLVQRELGPHDPVPGLAQLDAIKRKRHQTDTDNRMLTGVQACRLEIERDKRHLG